MTELEAKIVIVDDEPDFRDLLVMQLQRMGHQCFAAKNGRVGLELVKEHKPDLVMLDMNMPEMDGLETCVEIRSDPAVATIPVLMITGQSSDQSKLDALSSGVDDFLPKPASAPEISARVKNIVGLNRFRKINVEHSRFKLAAELSAEGLVIVNEDEEILFANRVARRLFRIADDATRFAPGEEAHWVASGSAAPDARGSLRHGTTSHLSWPATDSGKACRIQIDPIRMENNLPGQMLFRVVDISESVEQKLGLWGFTTILSHKFKTPLTGVMGNSMLLDLEKESMNADSRQMVVDLCQSAERLKAAADEAFDYVNSWGRSEVDVPVQVSAVIGFLTDLAVRQPGIKFDIGNVAPAAHRSVNMSWSVLEACLREIVANSRKFGINGKSTISVSLKAAETELSIEITDDGPGIPESDIPLVIKPLYQVDEYYTGEKPGLGIGLSMVNENMMTIGGGLDLRNRSGQKGLVVTLHIPLTDEC